MGDQPELQPWQRPPFQPGNDVAVQHGAYSPRAVDPLATELVQMVLAEPDTAYLAAGSYRPALWAWARAEAQVQLLTEYIAAMAPESEDAPGRAGVGDLESDRVRAAYLLLHRAEARADRTRTKLGLDPLSRARLGRDTAAARVDMARLMAGLDDDQDHDDEDVDDE